MSIFDLIGNITGILAFIISVINFVYFFVIRKKKLNVRFGDIGVRDSFNSNLLLKVHYSFENRSQLPISITRIQVVLNEKLYDCERLPQVIEEITRKRGTEIYDRDVLKSNSVPINLPALGATSGFLAFLVPQGTVSNSDKALTFRICTNRGKAVQKTFSLHEDVRIN